jgi:hypothetical protein
MGAGRVAADGAHVNARLPFAAKALKHAAVKHAALRHAVLKPAALKHVERRCRVAEGLHRPGHPMQQSGAAVSIDF